MNKTHEQIAGDAAQTICVLVAAELQKLVAQCDDGTAPKDSPSPEHRAAVCGIASGLGSALGGVLALMPEEVATIAMISALADIREAQDKARAEIKEKLGG